MEYVLTGLDRTLIIEQLKRYGPEGLSRHDCTVSSEAIAAYKSLVQYDLDKDGPNYIGDAVNSAINSCIGTPDGLIKILNLTVDDVRAHLPANFPADNIDILRAVNHFADKIDVRHDRRLFR